MRTQAFSISEAVLSQKIRNPSWSHVSCTSIMTITKSLLTVSVLAALAVSFVESYNCANSKCLNGTCENIAQTCVASQGCLNQVQEFKDSSSNTKFQLKSCPAQCTELSFSATLGGHRTFTHDQRCCQSEQCNKGDVQQSQQSSEVNGVRCPACYNETALSCTPTTLECTGVEKMCVEVIGTVLGSSGSFLSLYGKGCASPNACDLDMPVFNGVTIRTLCTSGSPPLQVFSPALAGLFLMKILL